MLLLIDSKCLIRFHGIYITVSNPILNYVNNVDVSFSLKGHGPHYAHDRGTLPATPRNSSLWLPVSFQ